MKVEYIEEPRIEFANEFLCDDPKKGLTIEGFYSLSHDSHQSEIQYASIGRKIDIEALNDWIDNLRFPIEASKKVLINNETEIEEGEVKDLFEEDEEYVNDSINDDFNKEIDDLTYERNKQLNPDFPGFNKDSIFKCEFKNVNSNNISIRNSNIDSILKSKSLKLDKIDSMISIYVNAYLELEEFYETKPDICLIIIPTVVYKTLGSIPFGKQFINFRRKLKAEIIAKGKNLFPVQLMLESTVNNKTQGKQDSSMIAWNFSVAQYYKTGTSIPWALTEIDSSSIFVGISFHKVIDKENNKLRSSVAQAFNREGKGIIITGKQFEWDSRKTKVSAPHLTYLYAKELIIKVIETYKRINGHTPTRVVIHKTTSFWDDFVNKEFAEANGFYDGIREILDGDTEVDLVSLTSTKVKLLRSDGNYPVLRGTLMKIDDFSGILYLTGYIPYYRTYPGVHIPMGIKIEIIGESTLRQVSKEILALSKLNFNNCNYYSSLPITLTFSQKVGEIIQYLPEDIDPPNKYYFYM